ncbi:MAG: S1C family serine protease, partial [Mycobacteriales bacterium]
ATASDLMRSPVVATAPTASGAPEPTPSLSLTSVSVVTSNDGSATVAAVNAVLPAVVTVINKGNNGIEVGSGSGVIVDKDLGYIVTNSHVVEMTRSTQAATSVDVILSDGTRKSATVVGNDPSTDIAVLRVAGGSLPAQAALGDPADVPLGAQVITIGSPGITTGVRGGGGVLQNSITSGIVSGKGRSFPRADLRGNVTLRDLIQTDAAINPGNSGGPLVWVATKQVIGLNTLVVRGSGEEGLGFAVSSATVKDIASQIIARGAPTR